MANFGSHGVVAGGDSVRYISDARPLLVDSLLYPTIYEQIAIESVDIVATL